MASTIKVDNLEGSTGSTVTVPTGQTFTVTDGIGIGSLPTITAVKGGTGQTTFAAGDILYANSTTTLTKLVKGTGRQGLQTNSGATAPEWADSPQSLMTAQGDILYASGANTLAKLAKGSGSDTLKMNSGATAPEWVTVAAASSSRVLLNTTTTAGTQASVTIDGHFTDTDYKRYEIEIDSLAPDNNGQELYFYFRDGSSNLSSGSYRYVIQNSYIDSGSGGSNVTSGWNSTYGRVSQDYNTDVAYRSYIMCMLPNPRSTLSYKVAWFQGVNVGGSAGYNVRTFNTSVQFADVVATPVTGIYFYWNANNFANDVVFRTYGVK